MFIQKILTKTCHLTFLREDFVDGPHQQNLCSYSRFEEKNKSEPLYCFFLSLSYKLCMISPCPRFPRYVLLIADISRPELRDCHDKVSWAIVPDSCLLVGAILDTGILYTVLCSVEKDKSPQQCCGAGAVQIGAAPAPALQLQL